MSYNAITLRGKAWTGRAWHGAARQGKDKPMAGRLAVGFFNGDKTMTDQTGGFAPELLERRGPGRPPKQPAVADDAAASLARAEARIQQLRGSMPEMGGYRDKFEAPPAPPGWSYEWKRSTVFNWHDPSYSVELARNGWTPVPLSRHPERMPPGWTGQTIEQDGCILMERPLVITQRAREIERMQAREAVATKESQLRATNKNDLGQRQVLNFAKSSSPIEIPPDEQ